MEIFNLFFLPIRDGGKRILEEEAKRQLGQIPRESSSTSLFDLSYRAIQLTSKAAGLLGNIVSVTSSIFWNMLSNFQTKIARENSIPTIQNHPSPLADFESSTKVVQEDWKLDLILLAILAGILYYCNHHTRVIQVHLNANPLKRENYVLCHQQKDGEMCLNLTFDPKKKFPTFEYSKKEN